MKRLVLLVGFVTLVANSAAAQRSQNIEFGGFGSWWRFDRSFQITNSFGGGARIGYNLSDRVGIEVTGDYIATTNLASTQNIDVSTVSGGRGFNTTFNWYWGAQGGFFVSKTNTQPYVYDPIAGGHWLITSRRTALYVAYEQAFFLSDANAVIFDPNSSGCSVGAAPCRDVSFNGVRRLMFGVLAYPTQKVIEPFGGGGFAIMQILNPVVDCPGCDLSQFSQADDRVNDAASKAFFWIMGGLQINYSSKFNVFAHYLLTSGASNFLLLSNTHTLQGGVRISLGTSKEGITERH